MEIRGLLRILWDFAMWRGDVPTQRNPMELVTIKGAIEDEQSKPRSLTVEEFQRFVVHLGNHSARWPCCACASASNQRSTSPEVGRCGLAQRQAQR